MYLDSAILVKLVVREPDSGFYADYVEQTQEVWTSELTLTECFSALCRQEREHRITKRVRREAWARFEAMSASGMLALVPLNALILRGANRILEVCAPHLPLRSLDAIQLAACEHVAAWPLVTNDRSMRRAAARLEFPLGPLPGPQE